MSNTHKLRAVFRLPKTQVEAILARDSERAGVVSEVEVTAQEIAGQFCAYATGPTQAVMFLIGAVAAKGESSLIAADPI